MAIRMERRFPSCCCFNDTLPFLREKIRKGKEKGRIITNPDGTIDMVPGYEKEIPIDEFTDFTDKDTTS